MTKLELEKRVAELEKQLEGMPDVERLKQRNEQLLQEGYDHKRRHGELETEFKKHKEVHQGLITKFNRLAQIFEEYTKASEDTIEINKLFLRNALRTQELLNAKIKAFNGGGEK
jgi:FtsZ-binding cell division protein ZapB